VPTTPAPIDTNESAVLEFGSPLETLTLGTATGDMSEVPLGTSPVLELVLLLLLLLLVVLLLLLVEVVMMAD
jgi:hypothetical protein